MGSWYGKPWLFCLWPRALQWSGKSSEMFGNLLLGNKPPQPWRLKHRKEAFICWKFRMWPELPRGIRWEAVWLWPDLLLRWLMHVVGKEVLAVPWTLRVGLSSTGQLGSSRVIGGFGGGMFQEQDIQRDNAQIHIQPQCLLYPDFTLKLVSWPSWVNTGGSYPREWIPEDGVHWGPPKEFFTRSGLTLIWLGALTCVSFVNLGTFLSLSVPFSAHL